MSDLAIEARGVTKVYGEGAVAYHALRGVDFAVRRGEFVMLSGPSGSGKTTLLSILGCVDLDGDRGIAGDPERRLTVESVGGLRRVLFVAVEDRARGLRGFSHAAMEEGHRAFPRASELMVYDATGARCAVEACAHLALVNTRPAARGNASYARFDGGPVNTAWLARVERWLAE